MTSKMMLNRALRKELSVNHLVLVRLSTRQDSENGQAFNDYERFHVKLRKVLDVLDERLYQVYTFKYEKKHIVVDIAATLDVSPSTINNWERKLLGKIAFALGVENIKDLLVAMGSEVYRKRRQVIL